MDNLVLQIIGMSSEEGNRFIHDDENERFVSWMEAYFLDRVRPAGSWLFGVGIEGALTFGDMGGRIKLPEVYPRIVRAEAEARSIR